MAAIRIGAVPVAAIRFNAALILAIRIAVCADTGGIVDAGGIAVI
jgi:hypothetical protein